MKYKNITAFILLIVLSCKKNGTGGKANLSITTMHHERIVPFSNVYIKYASKEFPGEDDSNYDGTRLTDINGQTEIKGLLPGDYFLFARGYDSLVKAEVKGGVGVKISRKGRDSDIELIVAITE